MSRIRANTIVNGAGTGAPNFPRGAIISGISTITADITTDTVNVGTGTSISSPATNELALGTNNAERVRITSDGSVGIGTTAPEQNLHIHAENSGLSAIRLGGSAANQITYDIRQGIVGVNNAGFSIRDITNSENKFVITHTGDTQITNGNLKFSTAGTGIDFSATGDATGATSELLDDYEEGTWTPRLSGGAGEYTPGISNYGWYRKIGTIVYYGGTLHWTAQVTAATGNIYISGLPFTAAAGGTANRGPGTLGAVGGGLTFTSGYTQWTLITDPGANFAYIIQIATNGASYSHYPTIGSSGIVYGFGGMYVASS